MITFLANGAATLPPDPPCSIKTLIAYRGFSNGAKAINQDMKKGLIKEGYDADILFWDINSIDEIPYWFGNSNSKISKIVKCGKILAV